VADNYLQYSSFLKYRKGRKRNKLLDMMNNPKKYGLHDEYGPIEFEEEDKGIWIYSHEYGNPNLVIETVRMWQENESISKPFRICWACTCSKPRVDEFCGGGAVVKKGVAYVVPDALDLAERMAKQGGKDG